MTSKNDATPTVLISMPLEEAAYRIKTLALAGVIICVDRGSANDWDSAVPAMQAIAQTIEELAGSLAENLDMLERTWRKAA